MSDRFDPLEISARKPLDAIAKVSFWCCFGIPAGAALIWGIYNPENISSVLGVAARRAGGAAIQETAPVGEALVNGTSGKGLKPGDSGRHQLNQSVRPSEVRNLGQ